MGHGTALALGMEVMGVDGTLVGTVRHLAADHLLIDRPWRRDIYVPFAAIRALADSRIVLTVPAAAVGHMDWLHPPLLPVCPGRLRGMSE